MALPITVTEIRQREKFIDAFVADEKFGEGIRILNDNLKQCERLAFANETLAADDVFEALELAKYLALDRRFRNALIHARKKYGLPQIIALRFSLSVLSPSEIHRVDAIALAITRRVVAALSGPRAINGSPSHPDGTRFVVMKRRLIVAGVGMGPAPGRG